MASVRLEFFGVARSRANVATIDLEASDLRNVTAQLAQQFPDLAELCLVDDQVASGWLLNINGARFTRDLDTTLHDGDSILLMPADAGG